MSQGEIENAGVPESEDDTEYSFESVDIAQHVRVWGEKATVQRMKEARREKLLDWGEQYAAEEDAVPTTITFTCQDNHGSSQWEDGAIKFWETGGRDAEVEEERPRPPAGPLPTAKRVRFSERAKTAKRSRGGKLLGNL
jgi:hypothetical protein